MDADAGGQTGVGRDAVLTRGLAGPAEQLSWARPPAERCRQSRELEDERRRRPRLGHHQGPTDGIEADVGTQQRA
jgi:hypothetical protein